MSECYREWEMKGGVWVCQHNVSQRGLEEDLLREFGLDKRQAKRSGRMPLWRGWGHSRRAGYVLSHAVVQGVLFTGREVSRATLALKSSKWGSRLGRGWEVGPLGFSRETCSPAGAQPLYYSPNELQPVKYPYVRHPKHPQNRSSYCRTRATANASPYASLRLICVSGSIH